jgi:hypothetical protein
MLLWLAAGSNDHFFALLLLLLQAVLEFKWETFAGGWVKFEFMWAIPRARRLL